MSAASEYRKVLKLRKRFAGEKTMTACVRAAMKHLGVFDVDGLDYFVPQFSLKQIRGVIVQFKRTGEVTSGRAPGVYNYIGKPKQRTKLDIIWHLVRSHRRFSTDDIERLSGAKRETALEYLHCLRKLGYIRQMRRGFWQLVDDPGPDTPVNTAKCARLKRIRKKKVMSNE